MRNHNKFGNGFILRLPRKFSTRMGVPGKDAPTQQECPQQGRGFTFVRQAILWMLLRTHNTPLSCGVTMPETTLSWKVMHLATCRGRHFQERFMSSSTCCQTTGRCAHPSSLRTCHQLLMQLQMALWLFAPMVRACPKHAQAMEQRHGSCLTLLLLKTARDTALPLEPKGTLTHADQNSKARMPVSWHSARCALIATCGRVP